MKYPTIIFICLIVGVIVFFSFYNGSDNKDNNVVQEPSSPDQNYARDESKIPELVKLDETLKLEAKTYIDEITKTAPESVAADKADAFVTKAQSISLFPQHEYEIVKPSELLDDKKLNKDSPITIVRQQEQIESLTPAQILAESAGNLSSKVKILDADEIKELLVGDIIEQFPDDADVAVIKTIEQLEIKTPREILQDSSINPDQPIKVIKKPYKLQTTTVAELLMGQEGLDSGDVFYVRNVNDTDQQGIWGIVHNGLVDNFASGIAIRRDEKIERYQVDIPQDADERLSDKSSSYLGRLIQTKTSESYVYNFKEGKMGRNPNLIFPGQEIVIISFTADELIKIYQHFVSRANS